MYKKEILIHMSNTKKFFTYLEFYALELLQNNKNHCMKNFKIC